MIPQFYTHRPDWPARIEAILELLGRVSAIEELSDRVPELRRTNRINSVHSSTAIEGNQLTVGQVADLAEGQAVIAPPRDVLEVENALAAYDALAELDPWSVADFLRAHRLLTAGLITESGEFRTVDVEIVNPAGDVIHTGSRTQKVPRLVAEMLAWGSTSTDHPLIVSSAAHFLIEHIHPFRDGNGRIGRLWQTLILSRWRPVFAWLPTETLIRQRQEGYYRALQASRDPEIDAATFIDYMVDVITEALTGYAARAQVRLKEAQGLGDVGTNVGVNVGTNDEETLLAMLRSDPTLNAVDLAARLGKTSRTVERHLSALKAAGRLRREGSTKAGQWVVEP